MTFLVLNPKWLKSSEVPMPAARAAVNLVVSAAARAGTAVTPGAASAAIVEWREFLSAENELGPEEYEAAMVRWTAKMMEIFGRCFANDEDEAVTRCTVRDLLEKVVTDASRHEGADLVDDMTVTTRGVLSTRGQNVPAILPPFYFSDPDCGSLLGKVVPRELLDEAASNGRVMLERGEGYVKMCGVEMRVSVEMAPGIPHIPKNDGDDAKLHNAGDKDLGLPGDGTPAKGIDVSTAGALAQFGFKTGSTLKTEHKRVAAEVLKSIAAVTDGPLQYVSVHFADLKGTTDYAHLLRNAAIAEQRLKDLARVGSSRADVLADDTLELALSAIATMAYAHETGDMVGAAAVDALHGSDGILLSVDSRARAAQFAKAQFKLQQYGGTRGPGKGKQQQQQQQQSQQYRTGAECFYCRKKGHLQRDCWWYQQGLPPPGGKKGDGKGAKMNKDAAGEK